MKSKQEVKDARIEVRAKIEHFQHLKSVQFPKGFPTNGADCNKSEYSLIMHTLKQLSIQDDALTYVLNEDLPLVDVTYQYEERGRYRTSEEPEEILPIYPN